MATHPSTLAWRIPWTEEPGGYSPWGRTESDTTEATERARTGESSSRDLFPEKHTNVV